MKRGCEGSYSTSAFSALKGVLVLLSFGLTAALGALSASDFPSENLTQNRAQFVWVAGLWPLALWSLI